MRSFIRHPSDIPINFKFDKDSPTCSECLDNVSEGGLCFCSSELVPIGSEINIIIPISEPAFEAHGVVAWCKQSGEKYLVGVQFAHKSTEYSVRMVEQVCHIEHFRHQILRNEGRRLTGEEAAMEWIMRNAATFPQ